MGKTIFTVVIPARYSSQRLPGKPLEMIAGQTMVERVYRCAQKSEAQRVIVATDDERIEKVVREFGAEVVMTSNDHPSGTDRLQEVATSLKLNDEDIIVNVQGDEPLIPAAVINQVARNLARNPEASAATLSETIVGSHEVFNPNAVKVVKDNKGLALYFSRAPMPWGRDLFLNQEGWLAKGELPVGVYQRHIGIYAYRVALLHEYVSWPPAELEQIEKLEQLRILAMGKKIHVEKACEKVPGGVDTPADLERMRALFSEGV